MTSTVSVRTSQDEAQIREVIADQATALWARDAVRLVAHYAPDVVQYDLAPPLRHLGPDVRDAAARQSWMDGFAGPIGLTIRDLEVTVGGDIAYCHSLNKLAATPHEAPEGFEMWFRATVCLRKVDGTWWITHEHTSTPFYMDGSFLTATDLQP
ncbi:YybH family protein [Actinokineospora sp.]|uniref:YybH family protein n=1 Tax=Actinokineospora sp. TaxID=1872133 RepID=UPI004037722D